MHMFRLAQ